MLKRNDTLRKKNLKRRAGTLIGCAVLLLLAPQIIFGQAQILDVHEPLPDIDTRTERIGPTSYQLAIVSKLGATVRWNRFGTPQSLIKYGGYLATGLSGSPSVVARNWIRSNRALFRLSDQGVNSLELVNESKLVGSNAFVVLFRQKFGDLPAAQDGMIAVGLAGGQIAYVSSSAVGDQNPPGDATLSPTAAWLRAAADVERFVALPDIKNIKLEEGWTMFDAVGFSHPQRSRLVAFPTINNGVRPAFETIVLDNQGGASIAYTHFIDAQTGEVLFRQNKVYRLAAPAPVVATFDGPLPATTGTCAPKEGPFVAPAGTQSIDVLATADNPANDIVLKLYFNATVVGSSDTGTSPEAVHYAPGGGVPAGNYFVEVCTFNDPTVPLAPPFTYHGTIAINDTLSTAAAVPYPPQWEFFRANPPLNPVPQFPWNNPDTDTRILACWESVINGTPVPGCQLELLNLAARAPWDFDPQTNQPTFTTKGNAANTAEAWFSPLTPGPTGFRPTSPDRKYVYPWTNEWYKNRCLSVFTPGVSNDISAAVVNLFAGHNRMHDWSYFLGFNERNYNMQETNFGITGQPGPYPLGREKDPETGDVQAGAANGGAPQYLGRDNANQITLNDGIPGITNQYLFQPIAAAFYSPCVDGDFDSSVFAHEYAHAISNRMVGGPDSNLTGYQAGSMGESWSDLNAIEYLNEYKFVPTNGESPFSVGAYVTGNKTAGIRNYSLDKAPLNYSDLGYDVTGPEVHADGEVWNAINIEIRKALITKYNASFSASNATLQRQCADGILPASRCPGNRRWIQIVYDAFLLMQPDVSMVTARDAYLAADMLRNGGANQKELWHAFALRGLGSKAKTVDTDDDEPTPSFESPLEPAFSVKFVVKDENMVPITNARVFAGDYEARVTPVADTFPSATLSDTIKVVGGTYTFIVQAPGYGAVRFIIGVTQNRSASVVMPTNWASKSKGGVATGDGVNQDQLIDDTEGTNWASLGSPVTGKSVTVKLGGGGPHLVTRVNVSALLHPADPTNVGDPGGQNRFSALRSFEIYACTAGANALNPLCLNTITAGFTKIYSSITSAFPGKAPRPVAPDLLLRGFDIPDTSATHIKIRVLTNQCTGGPAFQGEQDNDPLNPTPCTGTAQANNVRIAELQVFAKPFVAPAADPAVLVTMTAPATALPGTTLTYDINYSNFGPASASNAVMTDVLPADVEFVSATNGGKYDPKTRTVTWSLGTVPVSNDNKLSLTVRVKPTASVGTTIINQTDFTAPLTVASPGVALTKVLLQ